MSNENLSLLLAIISIIISIIAIIISCLLAYKAATVDAICEKMKLQCETLKKFICYYIKVSKVPEKDAYDERSKELYGEIRVLFCKQTFDIFSKLVHYIEAYCKGCHVRPEGVNRSNFKDFDLLYHNILEMMTNEINSKKYKYEYNGTEYADSCETLKKLEYLDDIK